MEKLVLEWPNSRSVISRISGSDTTDITYEHTASHKRCAIKRRRVPVEPGLAMTAHRAQGQIMSKVVLDLAGCSGAEQPHVVISRSTSMEGLFILREFDFSQICKGLSEDPCKEFVRLRRLHTTIKYGLSSEVEEAC